MIWLSLSDSVLGPSSCFQRCKEQLASISPASMTLPFRKTHLDSLPSSRQEPHAGGSYQGLSLSHLGTGWVVAEDRSHDLKGQSEFILGGCYSRCRRRVAASFHGECGAGTHSVEKPETLRPLYRDQWSFRGGQRGGSGGCQVLRSSP